MSLRSACATAGIVSIVLLVQLYSGAPGYAQQSTGQLLISSGFNPIAATTSKMVDRLMSFPPNQFQLRQNYGSRHNKKSRFASNFSKLSTKLAWTRHPKGDAQEECELAFTPHRFLFNFNNLPRAKWI